MNFNKSDFRFLILLFLFSSFVTSNHFLILNEETIVAICFVSFIAFSFQYFGKSIEESLNERNNAIKAEFIEALRIEQQYCDQIIYEHQEPIKKTGIYVQLAKIILTIKFQWYTDVRNKALSTFFNQTLSTLIESKLNNRLNELNFSKKIFEEKWLQLMAAEFEASVLAEFASSKNTQFQEQLLTQSISAVK